jgi:hypothetical protein
MNMENKSNVFGKWKVTKSYICNTELDYKIDKKELINKKSDWIEHIHEKKDDWDFVNFCKAYVYFLINAVNEEKKK